MFHHGQLLPAEGPLADQVTTAIRTGDTAALAALLDEHPGLAGVRVGTSEQSRSLLHVATDWPGHVPEVAATIRLLVDHGADVNARFVGAHAETPLHWAASADDVAAIDALLDAGADIDAPGAVLGGGSPLADACGFCQWAAARRLVDRGATLRLHDAAALGLTDVVAEIIDERRPDTEALTGALRYASAGGQRDTAALVLEAGADINWVGWGGLTALDAAVEEGHNDMAEWLRDLGGLPAAELGQG